MCLIIEVGNHNLRLGIISGRCLARARAIFCCLAVREYGYTGKEAGMVTGLGSAGVSIAVQRGEELMKRNPALRERIVRRAQ